MKKTFLLTWMSSLPNANFTPTPNPKEIQKSQNQPTKKKILIITKDPKPNKKPKKSLP